MRLSGEIRDAMRVAKLLTLGLLLTMGGLNAIAQDVLVVFVDGAVYATAAGSRSELEIGAAVAPDATIEVDANAFVEFRVGSRSLAFSRPGRYQLQDALRLTDNRPEAPLQDLVGRRVRVVLGNQSGPRTETAVAGARASDAGAGSDLEWAGGESTDELIDSALAALDAGDPQTAYDIMLDASLFAGEAELARVEVYFGYVASLAGDTAEALDYLGRHPVVQQTDYYQMHLLTLAGLYVETFAFDAAIELLEPFLARDERDAQADQLALLLLGFAYSGQGDTAAAAAAFDRAIAIDPDSEIGAAASAVTGS